jgi:hypothetical protein
MILVHFADHKEYVKDGNDLKKDGYIINNNKYSKEDDEYLPLYESKLIHQFDNRFGTYENCSIKQWENDDPRETTIEEHIDPSYDITPKYWVPRKLHRSLLSKYPEYNYQWLMVYRDVTGSTNQRSLIATVIPLLPASITLTPIGFKEWSKIPFLLANLNSIVVDFIVRTKLTTQHLTYGILEQLPIFPPEIYDKLPNDLLNRIKEIVLQLVYTNYEMKPFANDIGYFGKPYKWNELERIKLMSELNAIYSLLYGLTYDELIYIFDSFDALKKKEMRYHFTYITKEETLNYYNTYKKDIVSIA